MCLLRPRDRADESEASEAFPVSVFAFVKLSRGDPVAQWLAGWIADREVCGSNPASHTEKCHRGAMGRGCPCKFHQLHENEALS